MGDTAKSIIDFVKEFIDEGRARANSRWFSVFIISWLTFNWRRVFEIVFSDNRTAEIMNETITGMLAVGVDPNTNYASVVIIGFYLLIIAWCAFWIYGKPFVDLKTTQWQHALKKRIRATELATSMQKENMDIHEHVMNKETIENTHIKRIRELEREKTLLNIRVSNEKMETITITKETFFNALTEIRTNLDLQIEKRITKQDSESERAKFELERNEAKNHLDKVESIAIRYYH